MTHYNILATDAQWSYVRRLMNDAFAHQTSGGDICANGHTWRSAMSAHGVLAVSCCSLCGLPGIVISPPRPQWFSEDGQLKEPEPCPWCGELEECTPDCRSQYENGEAPEAKEEGR